MNLTKLFEAQRVLDERIEQEHPVKPEEDRVAMKILALQVELGECANEWRGFKFWSKNQNPVTTSIRPIFGTNVDGSQHQSFRECNPLLEELVDVLHFILSLGNEVKYDGQFLPPYADFIPETTDAFADVFYYTTKLRNNFVDDVFELLLESYFKLVYSLRFDWNQIETAYYEKNKINHERQDGGY